jgi:hypothetical protein
MENKNNNEIIDRVKLLMGYKLSMTLNENLSVIFEQIEPLVTTKLASDFAQDLTQNKYQYLQSRADKQKKIDKEEPGKPKQKYIWPIPGYTTYYTPTPNSSKGGKSIMYFPLNIEDSVKLWIFATPSDFSRIEKLKSNFDTSEHFQKILPPGTVRNFKIDGKQYLTRLIRLNSVWAFKGYYSGSEPYVSPDPEDYKSDWDKFLEKYKDAFQIIASVLAAIIIEVITAGTGTALAVKLVWEVVAELAINIPISMYERKMGDNAGANLSLLFSLLPFLDTKLLGIAGVSKEVSEKIAKELLDSGINDSVGLAKFYDNLGTDAEKYLFSQVLQQRPETIEKALGGMFKQIFADPVTNKKIFRKLAFKDKTWWKTAGLQFSTAMTLCLMKSVFTTDYSQEQYERMNEFMEIFFAKVGEENGQKIIQKTLESPKAQDSIVKLIYKTPKDIKEAEKVAIDYINETWDVKQEHKDKVRKVLDSLAILDKQNINNKQVEIDSTNLKPKP